MDLKSIKGLSVVLAKFSLNFKPFESKKKSFKQKILFYVKSLFRFSGDRRHLELMCDHAQNEFDNLPSPTLYYTDVNHCLSHCPPTSQPTWDGSTWTPIFHTVSLGQDLPRGHIQLPGRKLQRLMCRLSGHRVSSVLEPSKNSSRKQDGIPCTKQASEWVWAILFSFLS